MWKFKRWKIKWNPLKRKFRKIKRDRKRSRDAHLRYLSNRGKVKMALRKARIKGRIQMKKNKAAGIYSKLKIARERWKNILKSDMNLDMFFDQMLNEENYTPEMELGYEDMEQIIYSLKEIKRNVEMETKEEQKEFEDYIDDVISTIKELEDGDEEDLSDDDKDFLSDIISMLEEFGEEVGFIDDEDGEDDE